MTKPEHVRHWWGWRRLDVKCLWRCDLREGGAWHFVLRMADGSEHPFKGVYREIHSPERLVYTECSTCGHRQSAVAYYCRLRGRGRND